MSAPAWVAVLRDLLLMGVGTAGLVREFLLRDVPDWRTVGPCIAMVLGSGALNLLWVGRNTPIVQPPPSSLSPSSAPPQPPSSPGS